MSRRGRDYLIYTKRQPEPVVYPLLLKDPPRDRVFGSVEQGTLYAHYPI